MNWEIEGGRGVMMGLCLLTAGLRGKQGSCFFFRSG